MKTYEIKDVAAMFSVSEHVVKSWILNKSLKAVDVSRKVGAKAHWRITERQLEEFQELRSTKSSETKQKPKRFDGIKRFIQ